MGAEKRIRRALLSVTDKTGLVEFAQNAGGIWRGAGFNGRNGAGACAKRGWGCSDISDLTGFPEMLDGRVKTLHPKVHGGTLHIRGNA